MKKYLPALFVLFAVICLTAPASALQYGIGSATLNADHFKVSSSGLAYNANYGFYSANYVIAADQNEFDADHYYSTVLNDWAYAQTSNAFAKTGFGSNGAESYAYAEAGNGDEYAGAMAMSYALAYGLYMAEAGDVTISIDYALYGEIGGNGSGYSEAGAGALLGIYSGQYGIDGDWLSLEGQYGIEEQKGKLEVTLHNIAQGATLKIFAGTAAYAYAWEQKGAAPVPEPATILLFGIGLTSMAGLGRKKLLKK